MLSTAVMLAFAISALGASAEPQVAVPASGDAGPRDAKQVKEGGVIRGRITSLHTGKPLGRAQVRAARPDQRGEFSIKGPAATERPELGWTRCRSNNLLIRK
jgi:hypothetical protein